MKMINRILASEEFASKPPILIDIGASGEINSKWKLIAPFSICLAFDADDRDFQINQKSDSGFKKLISFNRIVSAEAEPNPPFYLTASPYCSSLLRPMEEKLTPWVFNDLFRIERVTTLPAITISEALNQAGVTYIDWFKTDTQGTDLRLFKSLPEDISKNLLVCELEPGIIDAYEGEDKLHIVMKEMHDRQFWLSTIQVKGTQRLKKKYSNELGPHSIKRCIRTSPCWAEVTYMRNPDGSSKRQLLLQIIFAIIEKQLGFALEICDAGISKYDDGIFSDCKSSVIQMIKKESRKNLLVIFKRQLNKILSGIND